EFEVTPGMTVPVKMMRNIVSARYAEGDDYQAAALPYQAQGGRGDEMIAVLPKPDLPTFERGLDASKLGAVLASLRLQDVDVAMPRFEVRSARPLSLVLGRVRT